jgi:hypothetical protein
MKTALLPRLPAALLLAGGITLLQLHASAYWTQQAGHTGLLWSLMIEGAALWLWAARSLGKNALALIASLLALSAPLYQLGQPIYAQWQATQQQRVLVQQQIDQQQQSITRLEAKGATYLQNSVKRDGWARLIEQTEQQIQTAETERNRLQTVLTGLQTGADTAVLVPIAMTALGLMLIQALVILTTRAVFAPLPGQRHSELAPESTNRNHSNPAGAVQRKKSTANRWSLTTPMAA